MKKIGIRLSIAIICLFIPIIFVQFDSKAYSPTYINSEYVDYCQEIGYGYDIDYWLLVALIEHESSGRPDVLDYVTGTHIGLMQLSISQFGGDGINLTDPYTNIMLGTRYLASLNDKVDNIGIALMQYHGESDALTKPLSGYAKGIINRAEELKMCNIDRNVKKINSITKRRF